MKNWNDCVLIHDGITGLKSIDQHTAQAHINYISKCGNNHRIWYDLKSKVCFGHGQTYTSDRPEHSFLATQKDFLKHPIWGLPYVNKAFVPFLGGTLELTSEYIWQNHSALGQFVGKSIMIVGAGPSAMNYNWQKIKYDYLWSCNHFFQSTLLSEENVSLFAIGNEVDTSKNNQMLTKYMKKNVNSIACFETTSRKGPLMADFQRRFPSQVMYAHTRYRSKIGTVPRLICLAVLMGASKVYVVGMDGIPTGAPHAFEPGKKPKGSPIMAGASDRFRRQYVILWDYLLNVLGSKVEFYNLGEGQEGNLSTDISRQEFPLNRLHVE